MTYDLSQFFLTYLSSYSGTEIMALVIQHKVLKHDIITYHCLKTCLHLLPIEADGHTHMNMCYTTWYLNLLSQVWVLTENSK